MRGILRAASTLFFWLAILGAVAVLTIDGARFFFPGVMGWHLKSAFPLIFVGLSCACVQFAVPRPGKQLLMGLAVAVAFILWGAEQFVPNPAVVLLMDDLVVFLFVVDLSLLIRGYLKQKRGE